MIFRLGIPFATLWLSASSALAAIPPQPYLAPAGEGISVEMASTSSRVAWRILN